MTWAQAEELLATLALACQKLSRKPLPEPGSLPPADASAAADQWIDWCVGQKYFGPPSPRAAQGLYPRLIVAQKIVRERGATATNQEPEEYSTMRALLHTLWHEDLHRMWLDRSLWMRQEGT